VLLKGPMLRKEINPGMVDRFHREDLTETVFSPSPVYRGRSFDFEQITEAGRRAALAGLTSHKDCI
jgi:hypothetical protein